MVARASTALVDKWRGTILRGKADMKYRNLNDGEILNIGDEYFQNNKWVRLEEEDYKEWISFRHKYDSFEMCPFRRKMNQDEKEVLRSNEILAACFENAMKPITDYLTR